MWQAAIFDRLRANAGPIDAASHRPSTRERKLSDDLNKPNPFLAGSPPLEGSPTLSTSPFGSGSGPPPEARPHPRNDDEEDDDDAILT